MDSQFEYIVNPILYKAGKYYNNTSCFEGNTLFAGPEGTG